MFGSANVVVTVLMKPLLELQWRLKSFVDIAATQEGDNNFPLSLHILRLGEIEQMYFITFTLYSVL